MVCAWISLGVLAMETFDYGTVPEHAEELRELAAAIAEATKKVTQTGIAIGQIFLAAKARLVHGAFINWCDAETPYSPRRAQMYMNLTELFHRLDKDDRAYLCSLPLTAALDLAGPSVVDATVKDILARLRNGERLKVETVKELLRRPKGDTRDTGPDCSRAMGHMVKHALDTDQRELLFAYLRAAPRSHGRRFVNSLLEVLREQAPADEHHAKRLIMREMIAA